MPIDCRYRAEGAVAEFNKRINDARRTGRPIAWSAKANNHHANSWQLIEYGQAPKAKIARYENAIRHRGQPQHVVVRHASLHVPLADDIVASVAQRFDHRPWTIFVSVEPERQSGYSAATKPSSRRYRAA